MIKTVHTIKNLIIYVVFATICIYLYMKLSSKFIDINNFITSDINKLEVPFFALLLFMFYTPTKLYYIRTTLLSTLSVVLLFFLYDSFYYFLTRSVQISDFSNAIMIWDFSPILSISLSLIFTLILFTTIYSIYLLKKEYTFKAFVIFLFLKLSLFSSILYYSTTAKFEKSLSKSFSYLHWSQKRTILKNGRLSSFVYYSLMSHKSKNKLKEYKEKEIDVNKILFKNNKISNKRNIYIVTLESFIDPRLLSKVSFSTSVLYPELKKYLFNGDFSHIISPVYGGDTAQAEFEILTGIKAFAKVNTIEFNTLEGNSISGFINYLKQNNYKTHGVIAANSGYFNAKTAYKSIGFEKMVFLDETDYFKRDKSDKNIFDGDLYKYNLDYLKKNNLKKPYIFYTLGMFGHHPYHRNIKERPNIIRINNKEDKLQRISNQFYYRTKALATYLDDLLKIDPNSIILISSDHIPPILTKNIKYSLSQNTNIAFMLVDGKPIDITGLKQYQLSQKILKYLDTQQNDSQIPISEADMLKVYYKALSEGMM